MIELVRSEINFDLVFKQNDIPPQVKIKEEKVNSNITSDEEKISIENWVINARIKSFDEINSLIEARCLLEGIKKYNNINIQTNEEQILKLSK